MKRIMFFPEGFWWRRMMERGMVRVRFDEDYGFFTGRKTG